MQTDRGKYVVVPALVTFTLFFVGLNASQLSTCKALIHMTKKTWCMMMGSTCHASEVGVGLNSITIINEGGAARRNSTVCTGVDTVSAGGERQDGCQDNNFPKILVDLTFAEAETVSRYAAFLESPSQEI